MSIEPAAGHCAWIAQQGTLNTGLADLTGPISLVLPYTAATPNVSYDAPPEGAAEQILGSRRTGRPVPRAALLTLEPRPTGTQPSVGPSLAELTDLLTPEMVRRLVMG